MVRSSPHRSSRRKRTTPAGIPRHASPHHQRRRGHREANDMKRLTLLAMACALSNTAFAQIDFSGEWDHPGMFGHEDVPDRGQGPEIGDYMGLPLNPAG